VTNWAVGDARELKDGKVGAELAADLGKLPDTTPHRFNGLFSRTTRVNRYQKGETSLDLNEARDDGVLGCRQSAPRSRQKTSPTPHHSIFTGRMLFLTAK